LEDITITCKVVSIHPFFDGYGNEFVCVEFGVEASKPPTVVSMPSNVPQEVSYVMPLLTQIPKMLSHPKAYNNRLILFLTKPEWEYLSRKYQYNDEVEIKIDKEGSIRLTTVK